MRIIAIAALVLVLCGTATLADEKVSEAEAKSIEATLKAWGCSGGKMQKETVATSKFEVDDTTCVDGRQYDVKLDKNFNLIGIHVD